MIRALNDRVFVRRAKPSKVSQGGILLIDHSTRDEGEVVAAGPDAGMPPGTLVVFAADKKGARHEVVVIEGEELLALREADLLAVVED